MGASNARVCEKNDDCRLIYRFIPEMMEDRAIVILWKANRKLHPGFQMVPV